MNKNIFLLSMLIPMLMAVSLRAAGSDNQQVIARLEAASGTIQFKSTGSSIWKTPLQGMAFAQGDILRTGNFSWMNLVLANGSIIRISANSTLELTKLGYNAEKQALNMSLKIAPLGRIIAAVRKLSKAANQMDIYTPQAIVGVRGTDLLVDVPDKDTTITGVWDGKVIFKDFTSEAGLSKDNNSMMMDFVHEISVSKDQFSQYKKASGFTHPKKLSANYEKDKAIIPELKDRATKYLASDSSQNRSKALDLRAQALK